MVNPSSEQFQKIIQITKGRSNVFWISAQEGSVAAMNPEKGLVIGLARSARAENEIESLKFITFDVQAAIRSWLSELLHIVTDILIGSFSQFRPAIQSNELEYVFRDGQVLIPRLIPDTQINNWITQVAGGFTVAKARHSQPYRPLRLSMKNSGSTDGIHFVDDEPTQTSLDSLDVEVEVRAHCLNTEDVVNSLDKTELSSLIIREFAGIISAVGSDISTEFHVGDRVCGWSSDSPPYANYVRVSSKQIARLPHSISFAIGAAMPVSFMTTYYSLVQIADLQRGQTLLIHGAVGDVGQAALTVAHHIGAEVLATVSSVAEQEELIESFDISQTRIFSEETIDLKDSIF